MKPAEFFAEIAEGPGNGSAYWITTEDGVRLRVGSWHLEPSRKGTILLFPGRTEYIELQGHTARDFAKNGYATFTIDWRGHGLSDRVIADPNTIHVKRFSDYQLDVAAMIRAALLLEMPKPWFLVGNSMGGCIGLRALHGGLPVEACAFTAPMWGLKMTAIQRMIAMPVSWTAHSVGKGQAYVPGHDGRNYVLHNAFKGNRITSDLGQYDYWRMQAREKPFLQTAGSSMTWLHQSLLECRRLKKHQPPETPCIAFCGENDSIIDLGVIDRLLNVWPNAKFERIADARHALLLEKPEVRSNVISGIMELFDQWITGGRSNSLESNT